MTKHRVPLWIVTGLVLVGMVTPAVAAPPPKATGPQAGSISALLPVATIDRGIGRARTTTEAKKGDALVWNDLIKTLKGGRARITLVDQSILSLGSQAELRIVKHDARSQQTALQMTYGRLRAQVESITREGGRFELRTPTAVAGVIGTDFGTTSAIGETEFLCISGAVSVGNADPNVPGSVKCEAGMTTTVFTGKAPAPPKPASPGQIQQLIQDTEPAQISSLSPSSAMLGAALDAAATGTHMGGINQVTANPAAGITVTLSPGGGEAEAKIHVVIAADAQPGLRVLTFSKPNGQTAAALFTILAPPKAGATAVDSRKPFLDVIEQERQSAISGLNGIGVGVKQSADAGGQQLTDANKKLPNPLDLTQASNGLQAQVTDMQNGLTTSGTAINQAAAAAVQNFNGRFDAAVAALTQRDPNAVPDDAFRTAVNAAFTGINTALQASFSTIHQTLGQQAQTDNDQVTQIVRDWMNRINTAQAAQQQSAPKPAVDTAERSVEMGDTFMFDAGGSSAGPGISIASYNWVLCDPSYKPAAVGVPLAANAPGCTPLPGLISSTSQFSASSCALQPADYIARVTVTDSNGKASAMDVRVRVLAPSYDDPQTRLQNLAAAYISLQPSQFLAFFDESYPGYATLTENIRKTFAALNAMNINLVVSQANTSCNDATVRADWSLNYTFKENPTAQVPTQKEQLSVKFVRKPGRGWFINDFQGDNGTVAPGPVANTDVALPDLTITLLPPGTGPQGYTARGGTAPATSSVPVPSGRNTFMATVTNAGDGTLTTGTTVHFSLRDASNNEISGTGVDATLPSGLAAGATTTVSGIMTVPQFDPGTAVVLNATVNPNCPNVVNEKSCANNAATLPLIVATVDLGVTNVAGPAVVAGVPSIVNVTIQNTGTGASLASTGNLVITTATGGTVLGTANIPIVAAGSSAVIPVTVTVPTGASSPYSVTASINPAAIADANHANDSLSGSLSLQTIDLQVLNVTQGTLVAGTSGSITVTVKNVGTAPSLASTGNLVLAVAGVAGNLAVANVPVIAPGASVDIPMTFTVPYFLGSAMTVKLNPAATGDSNAANDTFTGTMVVSGPDLQVFALAGPNLISGMSGTVTVTIKNVGPAASLATTSNNLILSAPALTGGTVTLVQANIPAIAAGATANVPMTFTVPTSIGTGTSVPFTASINPTASADGNTANDSLTAPLTVTAGFVDLQVINLAFVGTSGPYLSGETRSVTFQVKNNGNVASAATGNSVACKLSGTAGNYTLGSSITDSLAAGATGAVKTITFTVPTNFAGSDSVVCTETQDPLESTGALSDNTASLVVAVNYNVDLVFSPNPVPPAGIQAGSSGGPGFNVTVKNQGLDTSQAGWDVGIILNGVTVGSAIGGAIPAGQTSTITLNLTTPSYGTPPVDTTVPTTAFLNANAAAQETNTGNNNYSTTARVVDFAISTVPSGTLVGIEGRAFSALSVGPVVTVLPTTYPLPLTVSYSGLPSGLAATGTSPYPGVNISGTPTFGGSAGAYSVLPSASAGGVTHNATAFSLQIVPEQSMSLVSPVNLTSGGATQPLTISVANGVYPVQSTLTLPTGIHTTDPLTQTLNAPGTVTWNVSADMTAATTTGLTMLVHNTDPGVPATGTPVGSENFDAPYSVNGAANYVITGVTVDGHTSPWIYQADETFTYHVTVANQGNASPAGTFSFEEVNNPVTGSPDIHGPYTAPAAGSSTTIDLAGAMISVPVGNYTHTFTLMSTPPQSNTADDTFTSTFTLVDFSLTTLLTSPLKGVVGRSFSVGPAVAVNPTTYPLPIGVTYTPLYGLAASGTSGVLSGINVVGTPTSAGSYAVAVTGTAKGVTRTATAPLQVDIASEIAVTQTATPALLSGGAAQPLTVNVTGGIYPVTITLGTLPQGITTGSQLQQTLTGPGPVTWNIQADMTAALGSLTMLVTISDNGVAATNTPGKTVPFNATYSVGGAANYVITSVTADGHTAPYTGINSFQIGETFTTHVTVTNQGNASPSGTFNLYETDSQSGSTPDTRGPYTAPAQGQSITIDVTSTMNSGGTPGTYTHTWAVINPPSSSTTGAPFTASYDLVDFSLTTLLTSPLKGVVGRSFSVGPTVAVNPSGYPLPITVSYSPAIAGLNASGTSGVLTGINVAGTPTTAGSYAVTPLGNAKGVTRAGAAMQLDVAPEITVTQTAAPVLTSGGAAQALTLSVSGGIYPLTVKLPTTLPTGITTADPTQVTLSAAGSVTWNIQADMTAALGSLTLAVTITDGGFSATNTPAGNVSFSAVYSVGGAANYVIESMSFDGHSAPYTQGNALQVGETFTSHITIKNIGTASPTGTITIHQDSNEPGFPVGGKDEGTVAAPAAGQSITLDKTHSGGGSNAPGDYTATFTLTNAPTPSVVGSPVVTNFSVVDFALDATGGGSNGAFNIPAGGSGQMTLTLTETNGNFALPVLCGKDPGPGITGVLAPPTGVSCSLTSPMMPGSQTVTISALNSVLTGPGNAMAGKVAASNHNVERSTGGTVTFYTATITNQTLFLNDFSNPLELPINGAPYNLSLKFNADYDTNAGTATLRLPTITGIAWGETMTSLNPGDVILLPISAMTSATANVVLPIDIQFEIPGTTPTAYATYRLYVLPKGVPDLTVLSAVPVQKAVTDGTPWYSGEPLDWTVTIENHGSTASAGNENVTMYLAGGTDLPVGSVKVTSPIQPGNTAQVTLHAVLPDGFASYTGATNGIVKVDADPAGDQNYYDNKLDLPTITTSDWKLNVNYPPSAYPVLFLQAMTGYNTGNVTLTLTDPVGNPLSGFGSTIYFVNGINGSKITDAVSPSSITAAGSATATITVDTTATDGTYMAQVIAQMKDGGKVTAQRQATVKISVGTGNPPDMVTLTSSANNMNEGTPLQINGLLTETFTVTPGRTACSVAPCPGSTDLQFSSNYAVTISPNQLKAVPYLTPTQNLQANATIGPGGFLTTGFAMLSVSATAVTTSQAQVPGPDPVGSNTFAMFFQVGDVEVYSPQVTTNCFPVPPGQTGGTAFTGMWQTSGGFNAPTINWEFLDQNYSPVTGTPLQFASAAGTSTYSSGTYSPLSNTFTNTSTGIDGVQLYYFTATISNATSTATKYFPVYFDLSASQNFCAAVGGARGGSGGGKLPGFWGKGNGTAVAPATLSVRKASTTTTAGLPDVRVSAADISYTPSVPKAGDTVEVRFRISNAGDADATRVPIALQVNGATVASDTFDVAAGRTALGALQWTNARPPAPARAAGAKPAPPRGTIAAAFAAMAAAPMKVALVIDPGGTIKQRTALAKSAALAHFTLRDAPASTPAVAGANASRVLLELGEGACAGVRFSAGGISPCGTSDVEINVQDIGRSGFVLEAMNGIADLGTVLGDVPATSGMKFDGQAVLAAGHTYAVQLGGGKVGLLTVQSVRNPRELSARAQQVFRSQATKILSKLGGDSQAPSQPGDVTGGGSQATIFMEVVYRLP
jgi:hypothetical protein